MFILYGANTVPALFSCFTRGINTPAMLPAIQWGRSHSDLQVTGGIEGQRDGALAQAHTEKQQSEDHLQAGGL